MDQAVERVLAEYEARRDGEIEVFRTITPAEMGRRVDDFLISVGKEVGHFLNILLRESGSRQILELGTSYGHSTIFLAEAARATGGRVISCDVHAAKQDYARAMLERAGLTDRVEFRLGDAHAAIQSLDVALDFVLVDLWKDAYISTFDLFYPKLAAGAFIAADNMIVPEAARPDTIAYRRHIRTKPDLDTVLLPIGHGVELSRFMRGVKF